MKKSLIAIAILGAFISTANAADDGLFHLTKDDTTLDLYGILDAGYGNVNHSQSFNNTLPNQIYPFQALKISGTNASSISGAFNGGLSDSRWGIKGSTGVGYGMKAIFDLESGFDITNMKLNNAAGSLAANSGTPNANSTHADSSLNGGVFNRAAWVGVDADWGKLTYGLQNNPEKDILGAYDPVKSDSFSPLGESGTIGGGGGSSEEARMNHSIRYSGKVVDGVTVSAAFQKGDSINTSHGRTYALSANYEKGPFSVGAAYSNSTDAVVGGTSTILNAIAVNLYDVDSYVLAGKYKVTNEATLEAGYEHYVRKAPTDASLPLGALWGFAVANGTTTAGMSPGVSQAYNLYFIGGDYNFTPDLNLSVGYYQDNIDQKTGAPGTDGNIETWSSVLKYKLTKSWDLYAAATTNKFGGNAYSSATYYTNITAYGVGARLKF